MKKRWNFFFASVLCLGTCQVAFSEDKAEQIHMLDTVVVTAGRIPEEAYGVSQNVDVITEEDIKKSGAENLTDLVKKLGIQIYYDGSENYGNEGIVMRGGKSSMHGFDLAGDILVLIDGRRAGSDSLSNLDIDNAERIEILRGPGAVQYGAAAMGGVVNILTKKGERRTEAQVEAGMGSWNRKRYKASASGRRDKIDISASVSRFSSDEYDDGHGDEYGNTDLDFRTNYSLNTGWNFDENHRLGLLVQGSKTDDAGKGSDSGGRGTDAWENTRQNRDNDAFDLVYKGSTADGGLAWSTRYYRGKASYDLSRFYTHSSKEYRKTWSENENEFQGAQGQLSWDHDRWHLLVGSDFIEYDFDQEQKTTKTGSNYASSSYENIGAFILAKIYLLEDSNLTLSAGLRYDDFKVSIDSTRGDPVTTSRHTESSIDSWVPSIGVAYRPVDCLKFRANYAEAFKMPTPRQLGGIFSMMSVFVGNPDLDPEESENWDVGFDIKHRGFDFSATYFDSSYTNMITDHVVDGSEFGLETVRKYFNEDKAYIRGLEFGTGFDLGKYLNWSFDLMPYVYWSRLLEYEDGNGLKLENRAKDSLSFGLEFSHKDSGLTSSFDVTYYGKQIIDKNTGETLESSAIVDFNLIKRIYDLDKYGDMYVKVRIKNLFDKYYETTEDSPMPGRSFYVGLSYEF